MNFKSIFLIAATISLSSFAEENLPQSLTLNRSIELALEHNIELLQAESNIQFSQGSIKRVFSGSLPKIDLFANYNQLDPDLLEDFNGDSFGSDTSWTAGIRISQPLYQGGNNIHRLNEEKARFSAAEAALSEQLQSVILSVKKEWFDVLLARETIKVRNESVKLLEEEYERSKNRFETGAISRFELLRSEVSLANSKTPLIRAKNDYTLAVVDLYLAMGLSSPKDSTPEINATFPENLIEISLDEALATSEKNRLDYIRFEKELEAAEEAVSSVKTGYLPSLSLTAGYSVQKSAFVDDLDETIDGWSIGIEGSWRIWDSARTRGAVMEAKSIARRAELALNDVKLRISAEVRRAHASLNEAIELLKASRKVVEQAKEALKIAKDRYSVGSAIQLDLLSAEVSLTEARTNEINALYQYNLALAELERSMGVIGK